MVTKLNRFVQFYVGSSVLAKILMVTKRRQGYIEQSSGSVLAKILMVTKQNVTEDLITLSSVLAKILMVTKLHHCQQ